MVLLNNLITVESVAMITTTAPGQDAGLVWDRSLCTHEPGVRCSGPLGCRVLAVVADRWNDQAESNMARLHRTAMARVARRHGPGPFVACYVWEFQARGLKHRHLGADASTPRARARLNAYVEAMNELGPRHGFGRTKLDLPPDRSTHRNGGSAALYLSKYLGKATSEGFSMPRPAFVGHHLTKVSGVTMRALRWRRFVWARFRIRPASDELSVWIELLRCFPGLEVDPLRSAPALPPPPLVPAV
jgi:hypothetical protein